MNDASPARHDKFRAYRARKKEAGLREFRMWAPDVRAPGFWERSVQEAIVLRGASEEEEVVAFFEALNAADAEMWT